MATAIGWLIGNLLQMDHIGTEVVGDHVIYKYKTTSLTKSLGVVELKAKIMSILDMPSDIPVDIRVTPVKKGFITKEYVVEVEVPAKRFEVKHLEYAFKRKYKLADIAEFR